MIDDKDLMPWNRIVKERPNAETFINEHLPKDEYPKEVRLAVLAVMTLAQLRLEKRGIMKGEGNVGFCWIVNPVGDCEQCGIAIRSSVDKDMADCPFPDSSKESLKRAENIYETFYKRMPDKYKVSE